MFYVISKNDEIEKYEKERKVEISELQKATIV